MAFMFKTKSFLTILRLCVTFAHIIFSWLIYDDVDPYGQLQWLVDTLLQAEEKGELVHILSHVPPSAEYTYGVWMYQYRRIIER